MDKHTAQQLIAAATDIYELCDALNEIRDASRDCDLYDSSELPTFGGKEPGDTFGVYSWDADSILIADGDMGRWEVIERS